MKHTGTRRMWVRRVIRSGDAVGSGVRAITTPIVKNIQVIMGCGVVLGVFSLLGYGVYDTMTDGNPVPQWKLQRAIAENPCMARLIGDKIKGGEAQTGWTIRRSETACKEEYAALEQKKLVAVTRNEPAPAPPPAPEPDRWATPAEIKEYALMDGGYCIKDTIPGWRKNIGGGPLHFTDLNDIKVACERQKILDAQLAALPKDGK